MKKKDPKTGKDGKNLSTQKPATRHHSVKSAPYGRVAERSRGRSVRTPGQSVSVTERTPNPVQARVRAALIAAGLISSVESVPSGKLTIEQRTTLARRISGERPMSDLISEDREGR